jgi:LEA14-like dessication related protein
LLKILVVDNLSSIFYFSTKYDFCIFDLMKWQTILLIILVVALPSCQRIQDPQFKSLERFGVRKFGFTEVVIGFETVYNNPNNFGVTVKEADVDVYLDSVYLGKFFQPQPTQVKGKSDFSIPLEGSIPIRNALQLNGREMLKRPVSVRAVGKVKVGKAGVFVNKDIKYQGSHRLDSTLLKNPAGAGLFN